jgi:hypothetical protein
VVCDRGPERDCARAWGGGHRYTGYAYRLPDWIIDTTHRVSASTTTLTHPRRHTLLHNEWLIFVGSRMHLGRAQRAYVHPVCTCADTDAGTCAQPRSWRSKAIATELLREPPCFNSLPTRAHAHTHTCTRAHSHAHAHVRAQSNSDWKSARSKWFNELLGFCDGFHFNGLEILEDKVSFVWGLGFMGQLPPSPLLPSSPPPLLPSSPPSLCPSLSLSHTHRLHTLQAGENGEHYIEFVAKMAAREASPTDAPKGVKQVFVLIYFIF